MRNVLFIIAITAAANCFAQSEPACKQFRTGEFAYRDSSNNLINVHRKGGRQQEVDKKHGIISKFKIRWTGACEYELTQIWSNSKARRKYNRSVTKIVITKANGDDSYEYNCGCKDREITGSMGTMVRLSD